MYVYLSVTSDCAAYEYMYTSVGVALVTESPYLDVKFVYLVMFNLFQWVGYTMVFTMLIYRVLKDGPGSWLSFKICFRKIISEMSRNLIGYRKVARQFLTSETK